MERLITCCLKGIKITKLDHSSVPMKMGAFSQIFRFLRGVIQSHTSQGLCSELALWVLISCMWTQGHVRVTWVSVRCLPHIFLPSKSKNWEHFSYSPLFRESLLLRNSCYFSLREEAVTGYYFLLVMETLLGGSVRRKCISQLFFIYVFSTVKPPVLGTDSSRH